MADVWRGQKALSLFDEGVSRCSEFNLVISEKYLRIRVEVVVFQTPLRGSCV